MAAESAWTRALAAMRIRPPYLRSPQERAALEAAARIAAVAASLRTPECECCYEAVQQMEAAAVLLEEVVGCG